MAAGRGKQEALGCIKRVALTPTSEGGHALPPGWLKFSPQHLQIQELWEESRESSPGEESLPVSGDQERAGRGGGGGGAIPFPDLGATSRALSGLRLGAEVEWLGRGSRTGTQALL